MRNRDDNDTFDVPGRRYRDERFGGRRTGYASSDPDFRNDYPRHQGDVSLRSGGGWDEDREERLGWEGRGRSYSGGRNMNDYPQSRMELPYGEEGGYMNRGRESSGVRGGGYGNEQLGGYYGRGGQQYGRGGDFTRNLRDWDRSPGYRAGMDLDNDTRFGMRGMPGQQFGPGGGGYSGNRMWDEDWRELRGGGGYGPMRNRELDEERFGGAGRNFRGLGPKGYSRSMERVREDICEMLTDAPHIDPSNVELDIDPNGIVTLRGEVSSRREKRLIEDCVDRVRGVRDVRNELVLRKGSEGQQVVGRNGNGERKGTNVSTPRGVGTSGKARKGGQIEKPS